MKKSILFILALVTALSFAACKDQDALNPNSTPENQSSQPQESAQSSETSPISKPFAPVMEFRINPDVISDLGLTYDQMVEKRGKLKSNTYKGVRFENGIGNYAWKSEGGSFFIDDYLSPGGLPDAGGCNIIDGLKPEELFEGLSYPVSMNIFSKKYGFVPVSIGSEAGLNDLYYSRFTHPMYENLEFIFCTKEYGIIEKDTICELSLNMDSLEAKPIIPANPTVQTGANPRIIPDAISDLGLTYEQMVEKRGKLRSHTYKGVHFENGIGTYGWKSEGKSFSTDDYTDPGGLPDAGGCNIIIGLRPENLFEGLTYPVSMDIFSDKFGFVPVKINEKEPIDNDYWSKFTHPAYENVEFIFETAEYGMMDENSYCVLSLDMDSLDAKPVIPANSPTQTASLSRIRTEPLSDLGLTYDQMVEKRGKLKTNTVKGVVFENGIGHYGWKSEGISVCNDDHTDPAGLPDAGGCNAIYWLKSAELFEGLTDPITFDEFSDKYGLVPISVGKENGLFDCYGSEFSHPEYKDVRYYFLTDKPDTIDGNTGCEISLAVDALNAKPII